MPSHANHWLLGKVLRGEWHFDGAVVSDYGAVEELERIHHIAGDRRQAARLALAAGVDSELPDGIAYRTLAEQVRAAGADQAKLLALLSERPTGKSIDVTYLREYGLDSCAEAVEKAG